MELTYVNGETNVKRKKTQNYPGKDFFFLFDHFITTCPQWNQRPQLFSTTGCILQQTVPRPIGIRTPISSSSINTVRCQVGLDKVKCRSHLTNIQLRKLQFRKRKDNFTFSIHVCEKELFFFKTSGPPEARIEKSAIFKPQVTKAHV